MREIKFRAWNNELKEMFEAYNSENKNRIVALLLNDAQVELMQYTGIKDKNGKEIYEGDIVKVSLGGSRFEFEDDIAVIKYVKKDASFRICSVDFEDDYYEPMCSVFKIEVIGNVYENPELLS